MIELSRELEVRVARAADGYRLQMGDVEGELTNLRYNRAGEVEADLHLRAVFGRVFWGRVNLHSASKRAEIAAEYRKRGGARDYPIIIALEMVSEWVVSDLPKRYELWDYQAYAAQRAAYLLHPYLLENAVTVLAGDGGAGKGYIALCFALAVAGNPFADLQPARHGAVLYIDYESSKDDFGTRLDSLTDGNGIDPFELRTIRYVRLDTPYAMVKREVELVVAELQPALVILDSFAPACGGGAEESAFAIDLMRDLRALGCAVLAIAHVAKGERESRNPSPYGSVFVSNLARNVWMQKVVSSDGNRLTVQLTHHKCNIGARQPTRYYDLYFSADSVRLEPLRDRTRPDVFESLSLSERILAVLKRPMTADEIAEELGEPVGTVKVKLSNLIDKGKVAIAGGQGRRGDPYRYAICERGHAPPAPATVDQHGAQNPLLEG